uniref:Myosin IH n=1 Tax=Paramormyrops kingsleyae TaxID=1676925 RepID=A0A3B3QXB4_9TELE
MRSGQPRLDLEGALIARDRVGIQDFVLLDAFTSETAFLDNLKKRFNENLIYTYIGTLLVSVNPYKELGIYTKKQMDIYMGVNFFELPPHIYALADNAYHAMLTEMNNHFFLISGESGAGKTEACKKILQFYAVSCPTSSLLDSIRDRMLVSNPVLEAFGNAKTLKNDNSSRFGKYMDIQFDRQGEAVGGHILSYLLEKSRVVHQNHGERNFHIFYQLVEGGEEETLRLLGLERDCKHYSYLVQGEYRTVRTINDKNDWKTMRNALTIINFSEKDIEHLLGIVGSVLHLGNVQFEADRDGYARLSSKAELRWVSKLLGIHVQVLQEALTFRKIEAKTEEVLSPFSVDHAIYARDALAKALYGRMFTWIVNKINDSLENLDSSKKTVIGLLDIYGFEVFYVNSFEQFCINYCNEKLQQLFIQLTLKSEQEEYEAEGIEWEPVQFFNNKIICDLVEEKRTGIITMLDEECMRPGDTTDITFLERLEERMGSHPHFITSPRSNMKQLNWSCFRNLASYLLFIIPGFIDKNNDLLYRNIKDMIRHSKNGIVRHCFPPTEVDSKKRPETVASQFKSSLAELTEILMAKQPWYIRCLKSNEAKQPGRFDDMLVRHQVKYLGLMEHLRVRRAGFAYRRRYEVFLQRYKPLCPATWPHWKGVPAVGVEKLLIHLGYKEDDYKIGRTKIFIRHPKTLFAIEDAYEICKHELASKIQAKYKGYRVKNEFQKQKEAATKIETCWRGVQARKERERRAWAVKVIKKFIKGYMTRHEASTTDNSEYLTFVRHSYLTRLKNQLPKTVLDKTTWLAPPPVVKEVRKLLIVKMTSSWKSEFSGLQLKVVTSELFKGKKDSYPQSLAKPFADTRISISVSNLSDGILILHVAPEVKQKGDLVLQCDHLFETLTKLSMVANKRNVVKVVQGSIKFDIKPGKEGYVDFSSGQEAMVYKAKNGHLMVVSSHRKEINQQKL